MRVWRVLPQVGVSLWPWWTRRHPAEARSQRNWTGSTVLSTFLPAAATAAAVRHKPSVIRSFISSATRTAAAVKGKGIRSWIRMSVMALAVPASPTKWKSMIRKEAALRVPSRRTSAHQPGQRTVARVKQRSVTPVPTHRTSVCRNRSRPTWGISASCVRATRHARRATQTRTCTTWA